MTEGNIAYWVLRGTGRFPFIFYQSITITIPIHLWTHSPTGRAKILQLHCPILCSTLHIAKLTEKRAKRHVALTLPQAKFASIYSFCLFALIKRNHIFTQKLTWERNNQPDINILFKKMCNPLPQYAPISYYIWIKWTSSSNMKMTLQKSHNLICSYSLKKKKIFVETIHSSAKEQGFQTSHYNYRISYGWGNDNDELLKFQIIFVQFYFFRKGSPSQLRYYTVLQY